MDLKKSGEEHVIGQGKIFLLVEQHVQINGKPKLFEIAKRSPGTRAIIQKGTTILLTKEYRHEHDTYDYRLPGGKVYDTLQTYLTALKQNQNIIQAAEKAVLAECKQETGINAKHAKHMTTAKTGATIQWDLHYFHITEFEETDKQELELGESITYEWKTQEEIQTIIKEGNMREYQTVGVLWQYFLNA